MEKRGVFANDHPALAGGDDFVCEKAEASDIAHRSGLCSAILGSERFGVVFHDEEIVFLRERENRVHVARMTVKMHRHHRFRAARDFARDVRWIERPSIRRDIRKNRRCAAVNDDIRRGREGEVRNDDFVARPDSESNQREMQGDGSV